MSKFLLKLFKFIFSFLYSGLIWLFKLSFMWPFGTGLKEFLYKLYKIWGIFKLFGG